MESGFSGKGFTVTALVAGAPALQAFAPLTVMSPDIALVPKLTRMVLVELDPAVPCGNVQM